jgi:xanthine dehydrogenase small subunit
LLRCDIGVAPAACQRAGEDYPVHTGMGSEAALRDHITFIFRGQRRELKDFPPTRSVLDWLREDQRATGTKEGCNEGDCGACTVVLARVEDGRLVHRPVNACITLLGMLDGAELITIEDLAEGGKLHPIQQAMVEHHGSQCGFCTPGIVMSLFALGKAGGTVDRDRINDQLAGNLCRCTGYRPIVDAAMASVGNGEDRFDKESADRAEALAGLTADGGAMIASPSLILSLSKDVREHSRAASSILRQAQDEDASAGFFAVPRGLDELCSLAAAHPDATILAGATDVGLWITKQFRPIKKLIWLGRVEELKRMDDSPECLVIGAGVSHEAALPALAAISLDLGELGRRFGSMQVRAQGTVGGNIANGSPIGDWAPAFIALGAEVGLISAAAKSVPSPSMRGEGQDEGQGELAQRPTPGELTQPLTPALSPQARRGRSLALESFFIAYGKQDRRPGEIVASLTIPKPKPDEHFRCFKISKRFDEDISAVMGAFRLTVADGVVTAARVAFGGMAATPKRAPLTEAALEGVKLNDQATWSAALDALAQDYQPISDMRASSRYRAETARALLMKALIEIGGGSETRIAAPRGTMEATHAA